MKRLEGKPFALVGVNADSYPAKKLKEVMGKENLTWRSFVSRKAIYSKWNLEVTPTLYLVDHRGVIRYRWFGRPGEKAIDEAIDKLVKEAQAAGKEK